MIADHLASAKGCNTEVEDMKDVKHNEHVELSHQSHIQVCSGHAVV